MHFGKKSYLKSTCNHTVKHALSSSFQSSAQMPRRGQKVLVCTIQLTCIEVLCSYRYGTPCKQVSMYIQLNLNLYEIRIMIRL
jgi:hypothetical protein